MTLTDGAKKTTKVVTGEDGCVTTKVAVEKGPWTVTEDSKEGWVLDDVTATSGVVIYKDQSEDELGCSFFGQQNYARVARTISQPEPETNNCTFVNKELEDGDDDGDNGGGGGGGSPRPSCKAFEADLDGSEVTLTWETRNGREVTLLANGVKIYSTDDDEDVDGGSYVHTIGGVTNYELIVERGSKQDECRKSVLLGETRGASDSKSSTQVGKIPKQEVAGVNAGAGGSSQTPAQTLPLMALLAMIASLAVIRKTANE